MSNRVLPVPEIEMSPVPAELARRFQRAADTLSVLVSKPLARHVGDFSGDLIRKRTRRAFRSGEGATGSKLDKYSDVYAKRKGVPVSSVDLTGRYKGGRGGTMLNSIFGRRASAQEIGVAFPNRKHPKAKKLTVGQLAMVHHFGRRDGTIPARPFFDFTKAEETLIAGLIFKLLDETVIDRAVQQSEGRR